MLPLLDCKFNVLQGKLNTFEIVTSKNKKYTHTHSFSQKTYAYIFVSVISAYAAQVRNAGALGRGVPAVDGRSERRTDASEAAGGEDERLRNAPQGSARLGEGPPDPPPHARCAITLITVSRAPASRAMCRSSSSALPSTWKSKVTIPLLLLLIFYYSYYYFTLSSIYI